MRHKLALYFAPLAILLASACSSGSKHDDKAPDESPPAAVPPAEADDPADRAEFSALPAGAIIRIARDENGKEIADSATMRLDIAGAVGDEGDAAQVEKAFQTAAEPEKLADDGDELDKDSSRASWHNWRLSTNFQTYQPRVYKRGGGGAYWHYAAPALVHTSSYSYYYYRRPTCASYCRPQIPGVVQMPGVGLPTAEPPLPPAPTPNPNDLDASLRGLFGRFGVEPMRDADFLVGTPAQFQLGQALFFDRLLSGNKSTACATCHLPGRGTSDGFSIAPVLAVRESGRPAYRVSDVLPRNAQSLYNLGHVNFVSMFWDSRVSVDRRGGGFITPAKGELPAGLNSALAAQALFPLTSKDEMLGCFAQNELAATGTYSGVWNGVVNRVLQVPQYRSLLAAAFPGEHRFGIAHIANALAIFQSMAFRSDATPFDRYVAGDLSAMTVQQKLGATLFYGKGNCGGCHIGPVMSDQLQHNIVLPQFGPGASGREGDLADYGFGRVSNIAADNFKFKTPGLRNVALSGPWGHNGAYNSLRSIVRHYVNPALANRTWNRGQVVLPFAIQDPMVWAAHENENLRTSMIATNAVPPTDLNDAEIDAIVDFLHALTDPRFVGDTFSGLPQRVPSGLSLPTPWQFGQP